MFALDNGGGFSHDLSNVMEMEKDNHILSFPLHSTLGWDEQKSCGLYSTEAS